MARIHQTVLITSILALSWLGMMTIHEAGHVLAAWITGAKVVRVVLHPLTISRTDIADNQQPLAVVWGGPLFGVMAPLFAWAIARTWFLTARLHLANSDALFAGTINACLRFFGGFCLIANGAYLGVGSFDQIGDAGDLLRHGAPAWQLWLFGGFCLPAGLLLWHGIGCHFGLGNANGRVNVPLAYGCMALTICVSALMAWFGAE